MPNRRLHVTLLELLLVLSLLALLAGVIGINMRRAFFEQRFRAEVSGLVSSLRLAQDLMLILDTDIHVFIEDDPKKGLHSWIEAEKKLTDGWGRELERKRARFSAIHLVEMEDKISENSAQTNKIDIKFLSGGAVMSKGILNAFSSRNKNDETSLVSSICLPGYPKPIVSSNEECGFAKEADVEEQLTQDMLNEIQPRFPRK